MSKVYKDIPQGTGYNRKTDQATYTQVHRVCNVGGDASSRIFRVASEIQDLPQPGDKHPTNNTLTCVNIGVSPEGDETDSWLVTVSWSTESGSGGSSNEKRGMFQYGSSSHTVETSLDFEGNWIETEYEITDKEGNKKIDIQRGVVDMDEAIVEFSLTRKEIDFTPATVNAWAGCINSGSFKGCDKHTVYCVGVDTTPEVLEPDGKYSVIATYRFKYYSKTWNPLIYYRDKTTGEPPEDLVEDKGYKRVQVYPEADFNGLQL